MDVLVYLVLLVVIGLVVGAFARLALPGRDPMSVPATMGIGITGSFLAGLISWAAFGGRNGGGLLLSIVCAAAIVYFIRRSRGGSLTSPGRAGTRR